MRKEHLSSILVLLVLATGTSSTEFTSKGKEKFRILGVFHHPGKSHFDVFKPLLEELARRGHDVTVVSFFPRNPNDTGVEYLPNYKDISLLGSVDVWVNVVRLETMDYSFMNHIDELPRLREWGLEHCEATLKVPEVRNLINSKEKFDLILTENFNSDCFLGFVHRFQAPFIAMTSHQIMPWGYERMGSPDNPSYVPCTFLGFSGRMNFKERIINTVFTSVAKLTFNTAYQWSTQKIVNDAFGDDVPPLDEIARQTAAYLHNTHYSLHGAKPVASNLVEIGGIHIGKAKALPEDIGRFLDDANDGALLFSWGSMVKASSLPKEKLMAILKVLGNIPRKVIWKWETNQLPMRPKNVMITKWLPQFDVMNHPNVKAYLSHGGLLGLTEGVYVGLPMVIVPMYGDQFHNAAAAASRGAAVIVRYDELDEITLKSALDKVFNDTRYQENARALSRAFRDRPANPMDTAVWWSEFIARGNGRRYLRSEGADLPWYQYYLLDVFLFLAVVLLTTFYVTYRLMKFLVFLCCYRKSSRTIESIHSAGKQGKRKND